MKGFYCFGPFRLDFEGTRLERNGISIDLDSNHLSFLLHLVESKRRGQPSGLASGIGYFGMKGGKNAKGYYRRGRNIADALGQESNEGPYLKETEFGRGNSFWGPEWTSWDFVGDVTTDPPDAKPAQATIAAKQDRVQTENPTRNWDLFISHASEDKDEVARPLAQRLKAVGIKAWLDETELTLGDSLRQKIDEGLANCRYGVVIISKAFFAKHWPQQELNGLVARETNGQKVILPVWHGVDYEYVARFSPILADRLAVSSSSGLDVVVDSIRRAIETR